MKTRQRKRPNKPLKTSKRSPKIRETHKSKPEKVEKPPSRPNVPDVLYSADGKVFYPCKNCCRAFANKTDLKKHQVVCLKPLNVQQPPPPLPLASVENTMNTPKASELNNNKNEKNGELELDYQPLVDSKLRSPSKENPAEEKNLRIDGVANGIHTFDLKTKAKIAKFLNGVLENNGFSVIIMGNGDIVTKMHATPEYPQLEFTTKVVLDRETNIEKVQITLKRPNGETIVEIPEIPQLLEQIFGADEIFTNLMQNLDENEVKPDADEIMMHIEEEHFPTDDQVLSMVGMDGSIVLEDLDIHICKQCGAVYHTLEDLVTHDKYEHRKIKRKHTLEEIEQFGVAFRNSRGNECPICKKKLKLKCSWQRHAQSHCDVGMFQCRVCRKRFTRDDHRKKHEERHVVKVSESD